MAGMSYWEFKTFEEAEEYCLSKNLKVIKVENDFIKLAKVLNENNVEVAYITNRERAHVSHLEENTKWVVILD